MQIQMCIQIAFTPTSIPMVSIKNICIGMKNLLKKSDVERDNFGQSITFMKAVFKHISTSTLYAWCKITMEHNI